MPTDSAALFRLTSMIDATITEVEPADTNARALTDAYNRLRAEAESVARSTDTSMEFERIFPPLPSPTMTGESTSAIRARTAHANDALLMLKRLAGWLAGFEIHAQREIEAEAYASNRLRQEPKTP